MKRKIAFLAVLFIVSLAVLFVVYNPYFKKHYYSVKRQFLSERKKEEWKHLERSLKSEVKRFRGTVGLVIEDLDTQREIAFNQDTLFPSASLVKIPVMLACFYAAEDRKISLKDTITLKSSDKVAGSKILANMPAGSVFTVEDLFEPMITQSDNTAANLLINFMGINTLNAYFRKMGLKKTNIARKMMDFAQRRQGEENFTTAGDMAYLLEKLYHNKFLNKDVSRKCMELLGQQKINDRIPRKLPKETCVFHKTGLERHICHDVGIVFSGKGNFLICALVKHRDRRAKATKRFISDVTLLTYNYYHSL